MTTEASLLIPLVVILTVFLMFLAFYLYTVCFLNQAAYIAALRGSQSMSGDVQAVTEQELEKLLAGRLLPVRELNKEVSTSIMSVEVRLEAELALPFVEILPVEKSVWMVSARKKAGIRNAVNYIRLMRKLGEG